MSQIVNSEKLINSITEIANKNHFNIDEDQKTFFKDMCNLLNEAPNDKATMINAPCGMGKSLFISNYIKFCALQNIGLIVITDSIERLNKLVDIPENLKGNVLNCNSKYNIYTNLKNIITKPIVVMTTQKYFKLNKDIRESIFSYIDIDGNNIYRKVIVDETPIFFNEIKIGVTELNNIDTMFRTALDYTVSDKDEIVKLYEECKTKLIEYINKLENRDGNEAEQSFYVDCKYFRDHGLENYIYLKNLAEKYKSYLISDENISNYNNFNNLGNFYNDGGLFVSKKNKNYYKNNFITYIDNRDCLTSANTNVKFFVFDGTCDINPFYSEDKFILYDCDKYRKKLNLTINFVNVPTNKSNLIKQDNNSAILKYIKSSIKSASENPLIITYKGSADFYKTASNNIAYFGNVKGTNDYNNLTTCYQIGLNRYDNISYLIMACFLEPDFWDYIKTLSHKDCRTFFYNASFVLSKQYTFMRDQMNLDLIEEKVENIIYDVFVRTITADLIQNIFRLSIRNRNNNKYNNVFLLFDYNSYPFYNICDYIKKVLGDLADYKNINTPIEISEHKTLSRGKNTGEEPNNVQKVITYLSSKPAGYRFTYATMADELGLTEQQVKKTRENKVVREKLNLYKEGFGKTKISKFTIKGE